MAPRSILLKTFNRDNRCFIRVLARKILYPDRIAALAVAVLECRRVQEEMKHFGSHIGEQVSEASPMLQRRASSTSALAFDNFWSIAASVD